MMSPEKYPPLPDEDMDFKESKRKFLKDDVPDCIKRTRVQEQTPTGLYLLKTVALSAAALEKDETWMDKEQLKGISTLMRRDVNGGKNSCTSQEEAV